MFLPRGVEQQHKDYVLFFNASDSCNSQLGSRYTVWLQATTGGRRGTSHSILKVPASDFPFMIILPALRRSLALICWCRDCGESVTVKNKTSRSYLILTHTLILNALHYQPHQAKNKILKHNSLSLRVYFFFQPPQWIICFHLVWQTGPPNPAGQIFFCYLHIRSGISFFFFFFTPDAIPNATLPIYTGFGPAFYVCAGLCIPSDCGTNPSVSRPNTLWRVKEVGIDPPTLWSVADDLL